MNPGTLSDVLPNKFVIFGIPSYVINNFKLFNDRNKPKVNKKRSVIDNTYLFLATRFVYNYTHYQVISVTDFS